MKHLLFLILLFPFFGHAQKTYRIGNMQWTIALPDGYRLREDLMESARRNADELRLEQDPLPSETFFILAHDSGHDISLFTAGYTGRRKTDRDAAGDARYMAAFMRKQKRELGSKDSVTLTPVVVSGIRFHQLLVPNSSPNGTKTTFQVYWMADISGYTFTATASCENEAERKKVEQAFLQSTFAPLTKGR